MFANAGIRRSGRTTAGCVVLAASAMGMVLIAAGCRVEAGQAAEAAQAAKTGWSGQRSNEGPTPSAEVGSATLVTVERDRINAGPAISGELRPAREATVRAQAGGSIVELPVQEGQAVKRGQVLCRIQAQAQRDAFGSAEIGVRSAENAVQVAERDASRMKALASEGLVADRDVDAADKAKASAGANLADAYARRAAAGEQLSKAVIRAPFDGIVNARSANSGDVVAPGAPLMSIIDPSSMQLVALVPSEEVPELRVGAPVEFRMRGYADQAFTGRIDRISPAADPLTRQVRVYVAFRNAAAPLVAGMFAEGRVTAASREGLVVPDTAVDMNTDDPWVLRLRDGRTERLPVGIGLRDEQSARVEIRSGVAEGDVLLTGAAQGIAPGTPVRINEEMRTAQKR